jgi:hypothetical protein
LITASARGELDRLTSPERALDVRCRNDGHLHREVIGSRDTLVET